MECVLILEKCLTRYCYPQAEILQLTQRKIKTTVSITSEPLGYQDLKIKCRLETTPENYILLKPNDDSSISKLDAILSSLRKEQHIEICAKKDVEHSTEMQFLALTLCRQLFLS